MGGGDYSDGHNAAPAVVEIGWAAAIASSTGITGGELRGKSADRVDPGSVETTVTRFSSMAMLTPMAAGRLLVISSRLREDIIAASSFIERLMVAKGVAVLISLANDLGTQI